MYCNNCGAQGHVFRTCKEPIISCGLLLLRSTFEPMKLPTDPKSIGVLMVRRKDSMSFVEFISGKYDSTNTEYLKRLLKNMTSVEQEMLLTYSFEDLWSKLWGSSRDIFCEEFDISKEKFQRLDLPKLIIETKSSYVEPEWGFPKGRRMKGETDVQCAIREFSEETNIPSESYTVLENVSFTEVFKGTNDVSYKHVYFVALLKNSKLFNVKQKLTAMQRREISLVDWKSLTECKKVIRPHYTERRNILTELENKIQTLVV